MDGTLIDTNYANYLAYKKAIEQVTKKDFCFEFNSKQRFNRTNLAASFPDFTQYDYNRIIMLKESFYEQFLTNTQLIGSVADVLFKHYETHQTVLVTNCRKDRAILSLNHFQLIDKFDYLFFREFSDNQTMKINKYQNAILKLGVPPNLIVAFEDEESEIIDAQEAGISAINPKFI
jgi:beta-phosphoglucomutase-like phosphatase (HAD superfamily)